MSSSPRLAVAAALARASESINDSRTFQDTLDAIVHSTRASLPEFGHVSISVRKGGARFETSAGTDQLARELDSIQYDLGEGPCVRAIESEPVVVVQHLYSTACDEVDVCSAETAQLFATHAAIILGHAQHEDQLNQALQTRKVIGQALGIVMERYRIDADRAFQFLARASSSSNIKLRDVAEEIVASSIESYRTGD
jgi:hypothetical protein